MPAPTDIYTLSLHDALPIWPRSAAGRPAPRPPSGRGSFRGVQEHAAGLAALDRRAPLDQGAALRRRSEEHTSELQSHSDLVCRLLLEKKKIKQQDRHHSLLA